MWQINAVFIYGYFAFIPYVYPFRLKKFKEEPNYQKMKATTVFLISNEKIILAPYVVLNILSIIFNTNGLL